MDTFFKCSKCSYSDVGTIGGRDNVEHHEAACHGSENVDASYRVIANERYLELLEAEKVLDALYAAGVDNWDGYDYAVEMLED